jgi:hypothetical protein
VAQLGTVANANDLIDNEIMVRPERFELPASWFVARRSIQLSYGRARGANITTSISERHSDAIASGAARAGVPGFVAVTTDTRREFTGRLAEREGLLGAPRLAPSGPP